MFRPCKEGFSNAGQQHGWWKPSSSQRTCRVHDVHAMLHEDSEQLSNVEGFQTSKKTKSDSDYAPH